MAIFALQRWRELGVEGLGGWVGNAARGAARRSSGRVCLLCLSVVAAKQFDSHLNVFLSRSLARMHQSNNVLFLAAFPDV